MVTGAVAGTTFLLVLVAESVHARRSRRVRHLAFGPTGRPRPWTRFAPAVRCAAVPALAWGLVTLLVLPPKVHDRTDAAPEEEPRDLILVLDVSPSMRLRDAGTEESSSRTARASELLQSFFARLSLTKVRTSVVAFYTGAKPVVERTTDLAVVRNILTDLPMHFAFRAGPTDLMAGIEEAARMATPWRAGTATLIVVSDGDVVPPSGMPALPPSISHVLVIGVGDPSAGKFIDGHQSRQDIASLRQLAARLGGEYHDGNTKHVSTELLRDVVRSEEMPGTATRAWTRREMALLSVGVGAAALALLPVLLHAAGTHWHPGVPRRRAVTAREGRWLAPVG